MISISHQDSSLYESTRIVAVPSNEVVHAALQKDATARRIISQANDLQDGQLVGSRLNLNVLKSTGVLVNTIHSATNVSGYKSNKGWWSGKVLSYHAVVQLRNAYFNVQQSSRNKIALGVANKSPIASVDGELDLVSTKRFDGVSIRFNPKRERLFVDENNRPIAFAEHVTIVGHRAYARGEIRYYETVLEAPDKVGTAPCCVSFNFGLKELREMGR